MKKYLLLLFLILVPMVCASTFPRTNEYNVYLDGTLLDNFTLSPVYCTNLTETDEDRVTVLGRDVEENCTLYLAKLLNCTHNPCRFYPEKSAFYLYTGGKLILVDEVIPTQRGVFDMFILSDGSLRIELIKSWQDVEKQRQFGGLVHFLMITFYLSLFIAAIGVGMAALYFRRNKIPYKKLGWVILITILNTYILLLSTSFLPSFLHIPGIIIILEVIIYGIEALFYKRMLNAKRWSDAFVFAFVTNIMLILWSLQFVI